MLQTILPLLDKATEMKITPFSGALTIHVGQASRMRPVLEDFIQTNSGNTAVINLMMPNGSEHWFFKNNEGELTDLTSLVSKK